MRAKPKAGRRNPSCFFAFHRQTPMPQRPQGAAAPYTTCLRQPSFLPSVSPLYRPDSPLYLYSFAGGSLPVGTRFFRRKGIAPEAHPSTAALFEHNFPAAFPISNRPYLADARYRSDKIPPKFLVCRFLLGNLWMHVKIRSLREKPSGFRREGKIKNVQLLSNH